MIKKASIALLFLAAVSMAAAPANEQAQIGQVSPNFAASDSNGKTMHLTDFRGKYVVLEWTNKDCPFVRKHYGSGNMQSTQEKARSMGAVWFTIISSAPGEQGYLMPNAINQYRAENHVNSNATLLDPAGRVGHIYNARTTPQIVIMDPKGVVIYNGAIDDRPSPDPESLKGARNYALEALEEAMAGKTVAVPTSRPYGCSVKYAD